MSENERDTNTERKERKTEKQLGRKREITGDKSKKKTE